MNIAHNFRLDNDHAYSLTASSSAESSCTKRAYQMCFECFHLPCEIMYANAPRTFRRAI